MSALEPTNGHHELSCESFIDMLTPYLWGETSVTDTRLMDEHRTECENCQEYVVAAENALCREMYPMVQAYLDRELRPEERAQFERHIAVCERCRGHFHFDGRIYKFVVKRINASPAAEHAAASLIEAFRAKIRQQTPSPGSTSP